LSDSWPLSAAATHVLRHLDDATGDEVLRLGVRELVLRGVWRVGRRERARLVGLRSELTLTRGARRAPALAPVMQLDAALGMVIGPDVVPVHKAVKRLVRRRGSGRGALLAATRDELVDRGLVSIERTRVLGLVLRTRVSDTPEGRALAARSWEVEEALRDALTDPARAVDGLRAAGPLALLVSAGPLSELDDELRERVVATGAGAGSGSGGGSFSDEELERLDAFDPALDATLDASGGGSGDGGGGDGGGG